MDRETRFLNTFSVDHWARGSRQHAYIAMNRTGGQIPMAAFFPPSREKGK